MEREISLAQADLENVVITLGNLRGLLSMLRYSGQTPSEIGGDDLEGAAMSIGYIVGEAEDNIENVVRRMAGWKADIRKGA